MNIATFPEQNTVFAKDQPEYIPLPAHKVPDDISGRTVSCWKMTVWERVKVLLTGRVWQETLTFNEPLQPQRLSVAKPQMELQAKVLI